MSRGRDSEDDVPQPESHVEVPAHDQTAGGTSSSSSEYFTCVSSPSKLPRGDEEFNNNPEGAPQPESRVEVPAHDQTAGGNSSSSSEYFTCVSSPSKLPRGDEEFNNNPEVAPQPESRVEVPAHDQTAGGNSSSSSEYFTCVSSPSKLPRGDEEFNNNPEDAPQPESRVEVPANNQTAGGNSSSSSEYFTCVSSPSKLPRSDEGTLKKSVSQLTRKRKRMEEHPGEFNNNPEGAPQPESRVEVPAHDQTAGGNSSSSSEYFTCVSSPSKLPRGDEEFNNNPEGAPQPESRVEVPAHNQTAGGNSSSSSEYFTCVSSPSKLPRSDEGTLKKPVSQLTRKRKRMEEHPGEFNNNPEDAPQPESRVEVPAYNQTAGGNSSSSSEYFTCVSSPSKLPRDDEGTLKKSVSQLTRKRKRMEEHPGEFNNNPEGAPQPESRVEVPAHDQTAGGNSSSSSEYFTCVSSPSKLPRGDEEFNNNPEGAPQPESRVEVPAHNQTAGGNSSSSSEYFTCVSSPSKLPRSDEGTLKKPVSQLTRKRKRMEEHPGEFNNNPEDAPQPESRVEVPAYNQTAGGNSSSSSEYFTCVSSPSKLPRDDEETNRRPLPQDLDQWKYSSSSSQASRPSYQSDDNNPFMSSALAKDERVMTIYYMQVQMEGGVAVLCNTKEGFKPPSKKIKMEKMTYIEKVHKNIPRSHTSVNFPTDGEPSLNSRAQEQWNSTSSPSGAQPPTLVEYSRVSRPEWLLASKSGFRCMACLRVFPSLEVLREHVEHGVNEGFSCHTFHLTLARLKRGEPKERGN